MVVLEEHGGWWLCAEETGHQGVLHEDNDADGVIATCLRLHEETSVGFREPDKTLKHSDGLSIFGYSRILTKVRVVSSEDGLSFFGDDRFKYFLDEVDVITHLFFTPDDFFGAFSYLRYALLHQNILCFLLIRFWVVVIHYNENEIKT